MLGGLIYQPLSNGTFNMTATDGTLLLKASVFAPLALAAVLAITTGLAYVPAAVHLGGNPH